MLAIENIKLKKATVFDNRINSEATSKEGHSKINQDHIKLLYAYYKKFLIQQNHHAAISHMPKLLWNCKETFYTRPCIQNLGVTLDSKLRWKEQVKMNREKLELTCSWMDWLIRRSPLSIKNQIP